jgi:RIO-like serine/threonine protein kinase
MAESRLLKKDLFGEIWQISSGEDIHIVRDAGPANTYVGWLARRLLRREAGVLAALKSIDGVPQLLEFDTQRLTRTYLGGLPMQRSKPRDPQYFRAAARLLRRLHRNNVVHNDLAKEPNILVLEDGSPAFIDFQLAWFTPRRGRLFRLLAYEDLRHLLKHKRLYCPENLTQRERRVLDNPSCASRFFRATVKPAYMFITRRILGWADREGAANRGDQD